MLKITLLKPAFVAEHHHAAGDRLEVEAERALMLVNSGVASLDDAAAVRALALLREIRGATDAAALARLIAVLSEPDKPDKGGQGRARANTA